MKHIQFLLAAITLLFMASCEPAPEKKLEAPVKTEIDPPIAAAEIQPATPNLSPEQTAIEKQNKEMLKAAGKDVNQAYIDSENYMHVDQDKYSDHRIFGFEKPDITSKRMILISAYTTDVEGNPFKCPFGAYYTTEDMEGQSIKFVGEQGDFVEAEVADAAGKRSTVYFEAEWVGN